MNLFLIKLWLPQMISWLLSHHIDLFILAIYRWHPDYNVILQKIVLDSRRVFLAVFSLYWTQRLTRLVFHYQVFLWFPFFLLVHRHWSFILKYQLQLLNFFYVLIEFRCFILMLYLRNEHFLALVKRWAIVDLLMVKVVSVELKIILILN